MAQQGQGKVKGLKIWGIACSFQLVQCPLRQHFRDAEQQQRVQRQYRRSPA